MTEFTKIDVSLKNVQLKQSKKVRLLKYKEPLTYLSFSRSFQIPTKSDATIAYKPFILEQFLNESLIHRDGIIGNGLEYLPSSVVFSKPFNKYNKGHYYQYNIDEIHNISTVLHGLDFFNMDDLKKSLRKNLNFGKDDVFMVCGYDMFHSVDLRVSFMDDLKKYEIDLYNNEDGVEEIDIWEGVYVSEFIRLFKECDGLEYKKSFMSYEDDLLRMSDIKVEFQLFDLLIKYAPLALKSGFDQSQGFKEIDYLNNYMVNGIIKFFELRSDGLELLTIFLNKLIDLLDSHEVYLLLYLNLINHFRLEDDAFMNLTNQAITYFKDPYLIKQYLLLQLSFFERSKDLTFIKICYRISLKLFQLSPTEAFIQLNLIKYLHLASNSKHDFPDFDLSTDQVITPATSLSLHHSTSIKNFHFDYLLTEFSNPELKEVENIKTLTYDHVFHNYPDSKNGYVNFIWDNNIIFEDYVISENHFHLKSGDEDMDDLFQEQIFMENNKLVTSLLKELITTDEGFLKYILKVTTKESGTNVLRKFLKVYKKSLAFVEENTINKTVEITEGHYKKLKLLGLSYYFLGMYASCMTITELLLDQKFDMFVFQIYLKTVENLEDVDITKVLRNIVVALSFENRFYSKVHFKIVKFVKQELVNKRKLSKEYLMNESIQVIDTFINEKLVRMLIDFYTTI